MFSELAMLISPTAPKKWIRLLDRFKSLLNEKLGDQLLGLIALRTPEDLIYGGNVLLIVRKRSLDLAKKVAECVSEAQKTVKAEGLSPLIVEEGDELIDAFTKEGRPPLS